MVSRRALLLCLAVLPALIAQNQAERVDAIYQDWAKTDAPGGAVAVIQDARVVFAKAYGLANLEYNIPVTPDTDFDVGSVSKQFTAMCVLLLEQDGKLSLEDEVHKYLPELPDYGHPVTVRQLLQHTSGMPDAFGGLPLLAGRRGADALSYGDILRLLSKHRELNFVPGTRGLYSNTGYVLLAQIVARVSGRPFSDFAQERIFGPLGMTRTHFHDVPQRLVPGRAYSYFLVSGRGYLAAGGNNISLAGSNGLFTTTLDLAKWLDNFRDPKVGGVRGIALLQQEAPVPVSLSEDGPDVRYALGLIIDEDRGLRRISHLGTSFGFRSYVAWYPDQRLGIAVLANTVVDHRADRVAAVYIGNQMKLAASPPQRTFITLGPAGGMQFPGIYTAGIRRFEISKKEANLQMAELGSKPIELKPMSATRFYEPEMQAEVEFTPRPGTGVGFKVTRRNGSSRFGERIVQSPFDSNDLGKYPGRYWSDELETQYTIVLKGKSLSMQHPHLDEFALQPIAKDEFLAGVRLVKFTRDTVGAITGMLLKIDAVTPVSFARR
jgi:CubicO group peptidase (beta-lactamase class C family)